MLSRIWSSSLLIHVTTTTTRICCMMIIVMCMIGSCNGVDSPAEWTVVVKNHNKIDKQMGNGLKKHHHRHHRRRDDPLFNDGDTPSKSNRQVSGGGHGGHHGRNLYKKAKFVPHFSHRSLSSKSKLKSEKVKHMPYNTRKNDKRYHRRKHSHVGGKHRPSKNGRVSTKELKRQRWQAKWAGQDGVQTKKKDHSGGSKVPKKAHKLPPKKKSSSSHNHNSDGHTSSSHSRSSSHSHQSRAERRRHARNEEKRASHEEEAEEKRLAHKYKKSHGKKGAVKASLKAEEAAGKHYRFRERGERHTTSRYTKRQERMWEIASRTATLPQKRHANDVRMRDRDNGRYPENRYDKWLHRS